MRNRDYPIMDGGGRVAQIREDGGGILETTILMRPKRSSVRFAPLDAVNFICAYSLIRQSELSIALL